MGTKLRTRYKGRNMTNQRIRSGGIASNATKKIQRTNIPSAAAIVSGKYKKPTKEMIMSQRRAQRGTNRGKIPRTTKGNTNNNARKSMGTPTNVKGKWKTGAPKMKSPQTKKSRDKNIPKITSKGNAAKKHWPTLAQAKNEPKAQTKLVVAEE